MRLIHEADNSEALHESFNASDTLFIAQYEYAYSFHLQTHVFVASAHRDVYLISFAEGFN